MNPERKPISLELLAEFDGLAGALREGEADDAQVARLDQLLAEHPELMDRYVDLALLRADLHYRLSQAGPAMPARPIPSSRKWALAAAAAALIAMSLAAMVVNRGSAPVEPDPPEYSGVAVLTHQVDARWGDTSPALDVGSVIPAGRLVLDEGLVQIEFFSGARVVLEGPADFELLTIDEGYCRYGKLRAFVPPQADGFVVRTPAMDVVDRGTEFGLHLDRKGGTEVHVFEGKVELTQRDRATQELAGGTAIRIDAAGVEETFAADPGAFVSISQLGRRAEAEGVRRYLAWRGLSDRIRRDPRTVLYYSFEDQESWQRELKSHLEKDMSLDGSIIGAKWTEGRWAGKSALEFRRPGDRVRFNVPGTFDSLTLMTWVRVDALERRFNTLMLTDGWKPGHPHWQITGDGKIRLGLKTSKIHRDYDTKRVFGPEQFGHWKHLALVYDHRDKVVRHYVDGERVRELKHAFETRLKIGGAELGNWGVPRRRDRSRIRNLIGVMDEFGIFKEALGDEEIREMYEAGRPEF